MSSRAFGYRNEKSKDVKGCRLVATSRWKLDREQRVDGRRVKVDGQKSSDSP